jgi:hypothetical protein
LMHAQECTAVRSGSSRSRRCERLWCTASRRRAQPAEGGQQEPAQQPSHGSAADQTGNTSTFAARPVALGSTAVANALFLAAAANAAAVAEAGANVAATAGTAASGYTPGPVDISWEIWVGFVAGVVPFLIASYEFGKRIVSVAAKPCTSICRVAVSSDRFVPGVRCCALLPVVSCAMDTAACLRGR